MRTSLPNPIPISVTVDNCWLRIDLEDGQQAVVQTKRFPRLMQATAEQRRNWQLIGRGDGIHWPEVDEDISVRNLINSGSVAQAEDERFDQIFSLIGDIFEKSRQLSTFLVNRPFTPDGHFVASVGKTVAEYVYGLMPEPATNRYVDAQTVTGLSVQIMLIGEASTRFAVRWNESTQAEHADILLCLKLYADGFGEIYNGAYPTDLLRSKREVKPGLYSMSASALLARNPAELPKHRSLASVNRRLNLALPHAA